MPTAMRMVTTIVPVWVCTTNYGIPLFYSRIIKKKRLFVKCAIRCKIPRLFSRGITILEGFCVVLIYWLTHGRQARIAWLFHLFGHESIYFYRKIKKVPGI